MDEQKKLRNPNDLLIIHNIDSEDHEWQYDAVKTPLPYYIRAGETRKLPFYIAKHGVEKLIDKVLQKKGLLHTNPLHRELYRKQIVLGLEHINLVREQTPNEIALEAMKRKKDADPYEELLKEREIESERLHAQELAAMQPKAPIIQTVGVATVGNIPTNVPVATPPANDPLSSNVNSIDTPIIDPARQDVYNLLQTRLHLDLSHQQTREKFDATPLDSLKQQFADQIPELVTPAPAPGVATGDPLGDALAATQ